MAERIACVEYGPGDDFLLRDGRLFVVGDLDPRRRSGAQLTRARARRDDELERIRELGTVDHENVLTIPSASPCIRCRLWMTRSTP